MKYHELQQRKPFDKWIILYTLLLGYFMQGVFRVLIFKLIYDEINQPHYHMASIICVHIFEVAIVHLVTEDISKSFNIMCIVTLISFMFNVIGLFISFITYDIQYCQATMLIYPMVISPSLITYIDKRHSSH